MLADWSTVPGGRTGRIMGGVSVEERVAVVVVTFNSADVVVGLVESLPAGMGAVPWHLVVVDNDSCDETLEVIRLHAPEATVVQTGRNAGYAAGINAGVTRAGDSTAYLVLNPDVRLGAECVPLLLSALGRPDTGIAVPRLSDGDSRLIETLRREPSVLRAWADALIGARRAGRWAGLGEMVTDHTAYDTEQTTDWAEGSTQLVSRECMATCGPWDESFFLYSEETDFALRARDAGFATRYVPTASAVHLEGESKASPGLWSLLVANRVRLFARRHGAVSTAAFWTAVTLREASRAALGRRTSRAALKVLTSPTRMRQPPGPHSLHVD